MTDRPIALVTGGAQGIGYACAEAIAELGHRIVLADINAEGVEAAAEKLGTDTLGIACDMGDPKAVNAMFDRIEAEAGPVAVLVNNAGVAMPGDFLETTLDDFQRVIDINLTGVFVALQRAAKTMVAKGISGAIVNMSSINAQVAIPSIPAYCASKGGVNHTAMLAGVNANPDAMKMVMSRTPLQRIGSAKEIGDVVAFLASDKASYITGETIYVDGGRLGMNYTC